MRRCAILSTGLFSLFLSGCWRSSGPGGADLSIAVAPLDGLPVYTMGAAATWTTSGFLVLPSPVDDPSSDELLPPSAPGSPKTALLYSPRTRELRPLPAPLPESPPFIGAEPLGAGAVVFASLGCWSVDVSTGAWTALQGGPVGNFIIDGHASRRGVVFLYGRVPNGECAAWEYRPGDRPWTQLPAPPCSSFTRIASDGERWWVFAYDYSAERQRAASFHPGDQQWRSVPLEGSPDHLGAIRMGRRTRNGTGRPKLCEQLLWKMAAEARPALRSRTRNAIYSRSSRRPPP